MIQVSVPGDLNIVRRARADTQMAAELAGILGELQRQQISYCYWKSSRRLPAVLAGEGDIDLLIARHDQHRALAILLQRNFKIFPSVADREHPTVLSALGYDAANGLLIHLHLHFCLVLGEPLLKNYCIPWAHLLQARAVTHPTLPIRILDPAAEAVVLVVRACLELRRLDPVMFRSWRAKTQEFALDRADLAARVDRIEFRNLVAELLGADLVESATVAFYGTEPLERQAQLRRRVRRHFAPYRSYSAVEARARSAGRAVLWIAGYLNKDFLQRPRPWNRRAPGGGCIVAIMGVDGSGKSTSVRTMRSWLGSKIDVIPIYFGTGDGRPSWPLRPFKMAMPIVAPLLNRRSGRRAPGKPRVASYGKTSGDAPGWLYSALLMIWAAAVALDKRIKFTAAHRGASRGLVVLTDRYPQNQTVSFNDGPLLNRLTSVPGWLRRFEHNVYALADRLRPNLVIKLVITPETAARREPGMDPAVIRERITALQRLEFPGVRVVCVNAEQPLPDMIRTIKHEIWRLI
jgi:hypothetical protein